MYGPGLFHHWVLTRSHAAAPIVIHKRHEARHSCRDSCQAILPDTLRVNANLFQTDLCRNPDYMDVFMFAILGTGYPLPGEYDELLAYLCITTSAQLGNELKLILPMQTPFNTFSNEPFAHSFRVRFQIPTDGLRNQFIHIMDPTLFDQPLRLLPKLIGYFSFNCCRHNY